MSIEELTNLNPADTKPGSDGEKNYEKIMSDFEKFGMPKTADFKKALFEKNFNKTKEWLEYIENNKKHFPQYNDSWFRDRHSEIQVAEQNPDRVWNPSQTKEEAQEFLRNKFGIETTKDFRNTLESDLTKAEEWLNYIIDNSNDFPQYHATWDNWVEDRKSELEKAKSN